MSREKVFTSILMVLILTVLSGASVWAAPNGQEQISGTVDNIEIVTGVDPDTGDTMFIVRVTLHDELGDTLIVDLYLDAAARLGLVEVDDEGKPVLGDDGKPIAIVIDPNDPPSVVINPETDVIPEEDGEEGEHPVALALADFFDDLLGLDYGTIMGYHEDGIGFGVIAQACWMSHYALEGDFELLVEDILKAKKGEIDFSEIPLPDDIEETPTNWGQFKKAVLGSEKHKNLGAIMSTRNKGDEDEDETDSGDGEGELETTSTEGKVKDKKGKGPGEDGPPGQNKDKGGGKPDTPPGQENKGGGEGGGKGGGKGSGKKK